MNSFPFSLYAITITSRKKKGRKQTAVQKNGADNIILRYRRTTSCYQMYPGASGSPRRRGLRHR